MTLSAFAARKTYKQGIPMKKLISISCLCLGIFGCSKGTEPEAITNQKVSSATLSSEMVKVPSGEFTMGSNKVDNDGMQARYGFPAPLYLNEHPERKVTLDTFYIDKFETTNHQYKQFLLKAKDGARGQVPVVWGQNGYGLAPSQMKTIPIDKLRNIAADHFKLDMDTREMSREALITEMLAQQAVEDTKPVAAVTWLDADKFCRWRKARLPTEQEWEKAARGTDSREFPWGNNWDPKITNTGDDAEEEEGISPVGAFANNASPYGAYDMSGNVWEWVSDWYAPIPGSNYDDDPEYGEKNKVIRGGSGGMGHYAISYFYRNATRQYAPPETMAEDIGFRCVQETATTP